MAEREWQPGGVAMVTFEESTRRAVRRGEVWMFLDREGYGLDAFVSTARPLVVIDPEDREQVGRLADLLALTSGTYWDRAQQALREFANPTPPKPEEPTGLGAVVYYDGSRWVGLGYGRWLEVPEDRLVEPRRLLWPEFHADVRVLSEGVS